MKTGVRGVVLVLLLAFCVAAGYGWGNMTHVYIAKNLGVKNGPANMNEMYGAVLPDIFNLVFTPDAQNLAIAFHTNEQLWGALYMSAPSRLSKAAFWGVYTHNNLWGADWYAHGTYPGNPAEGWVVAQGAALAPGIAADLATLDPRLTLANYPELIVGMGHDIVESAVDVLVKRELDPNVGAQLFTAAQNRSPEIPEVLAAVLSPGDPQPIRNGEAQYREGMMEYGHMFLLPEPRLVQTIAYLSAGVAHDYILANTGIEVAVPPSLVLKHLALALAQVAPVYKAALFTTMLEVKEALESRGIQVAGMVLAFAQSGSTEEELNTETPGSVETLPVEYHLEQNYPNPFNPSTAIRFALPDDANVTLKIYNTIGQEVATVIDGFTPAGRHEVLWDAKNLPSGVYLYRMVAGSVIETKKMTLMK